MKRELRPEFGGMALALLGGTVMLAWWLRLPGLIRLLPGFTPMALVVILLAVRYGQSK
jgi:hypothetical protein